MVMFHSYVSLPEGKITIHLWWWNRDAAKIGFSKSWWGDSSFPWLSTPWWSTKSLGVFGCFRNWLLSCLCACYICIYINYTHILIPKKDRIDMFFKLFIPSHGYCPLLIWQVLSWKATMFKNGTSYYHWTKCAIDTFRQASMYWGYNVRPPSCKLVYKPQ